MSMFDWQQGLFWARDHLRMPPQSEVKRMPIPRHQQRGPTCCCHVGASDIQGYPFVWVPLIGFCSVWGCKKVFPCFGKCPCRWKPEKRSLATALLPHVEELLHNLHRVCVDVQCISWGRQHEGDGLARGAQRGLFWGLGFRV